LGGEGTKFGTELQHNTCIIKERWKRGSTHNSDLQRGGGGVVGTPRTGEDRRIAEGTPLFFLQKNRRGENTWWLETDARTVELRMKTT